MKNTQTKAIREIGLKHKLYVMIAGIIKWMEMRISSSERFFHLYGKWIYAKMLDRELHMAALKPGAKVIHIGAGALPYTAFYLARKNFSVTCVDYDEKALVKAEKLLKRIGVSDRIKVVKLDGIDVDSSGFDAVWISLHVTPKEPILERLMDKADPRCVIVCREPRNWLNWFYSETKTQYAGWIQKKCRDPFGKQSVAYVKKK